MNRDELLTRLAMEMSPDDWPKETVGKQGLAFRPVSEYVIELEGCRAIAFTHYDYLQRRAELINKPSWDDAPEWAQWLAQDEDGRWCFFPEKPEQSRTMWINDQPKTGIWVDTHCRGTIPVGHDWRETLERRPTPIKTCRHCDMSFQRPSVAGIPDDRCERCHDEISPMGWDEGRADAIGQNGPTGDHYDYTKAPCVECVFAPNYWEDVRCVHCGKKPPIDHYAEDSDIESPLSRATQELNPSTSSLTYSQAEDAAIDTGLCSDGSPCGSPHDPDDDQYCIGCPNEPGEIAHDCPRCGGEWWSPPHSYCPCEDAAPVTADDILEAARKHMQDRASTYDKPEGERSMNSTVLAFAAITGIGMTEEQGWLFMQLLKAVRSQQGAYRADSYEDGAAYVALAGEAAAKERL